MSYKPVMKYIYLFSSSSMNGMITYRFGNLLGNFHAPLLDLSPLPEAHSLRRMEANENHQSRNGAPILGRVPPRYSSPNSDYVAYLSFNSWGCKLDKCAMLAGEHVDLEKV